MAYIGNSPANVGNYQVVDDISSTFNGVLTSFTLTASSLAINPAKSGQLLVSINGVLQEPDDTGTEGFKVSGSNIVFSSAPATGSTFWAVWQGQAVDIGTPSDGVVGTAQMSSAELALTGGLSLGDNVKAKFGAGDDLQIYHDGSHSYVSDQGTGRLVLNSSGGGVRIEKSPSENMAIFTPDGNCELFYDNALKLATTSTGIDVTGSVTADGLVNNGDVVFSKSSTGVPTLKMSGFAGANSPYGVINFYNEDGSQQGPNNAVQIKALAKNVDGSGGQLAFHTSTGTAAVGADALERMRIDSSGNVGIGTTAPDQTMHIHKGSAGTVVSDGNAVLTVENSSHSVLQMLAPKSQYNIIVFGNPTDGALSGRIQYDNNNKVMQLWTNSTERMRITSAGNVGIGTTSPSEKLHIETSTASPAILVKAASQTGSTTPTAELILSNGSLSSNDSACKVIAYRIGDYSTTPLRQSGLKFQTTNANAAVTAMTITNTGNVGIGTDAPATQLHVEALNNSAGDVWTGVGPGNIPSITIQNSGTTDNVNAAIFFKNDTDMTASIGARFVNHVSNETEVRISTNDGSSTRERVIVKGTGAVTMPYQPAFSAYTPNGSQGSWSDGANHSMPLTSSAFMRGGCSLGSNVVTVPTTGLYHVTVIFQSMTTSYNIRAGSIRLMHNGSTILAHTSSDTWNAENYVGWSNHHYTWRSHYLIQASANDYFGARTWIYHNGGTPSVGYQVAIRGHLIG